MKLKKINYICMAALFLLCSCKQSYVDELSTGYATFSVDERDLFVGRQITGPV